MPELWKRLERHSILVRPDETVKQVLDRVSHELAIDMGFPDPADRLASSYLGSRLRMGEHEPVEPVEWKTADVLARAYGDVILERSQVRFVSREEALAFWNSWWLEEQKK